MNTTIKCVILDDEILAISYLKLLCEQIEGVEIVKAFNNPHTFLSEIKNTDCEVCILDIQMPGMSGLQVAAQVADTKKIIFTTAFDEYAADAYDLNVIDYVRKPIQKDRLNQAFDKIKNLQATSLRNNFIEWNANIGRTKIFTKDILYIKTSEIDSRDKEVFLRDGTTLIFKNLNFKTLLEMLPEREFVQINKQEVLAVSSIKIISANEIITKIPTENSFLKLQIGEAYKRSVNQILL